MKNINNSENGCFGNAKYKFFTSLRLTVLVIIFTSILSSQDYEPAEFKVRYKGNDRGYFSPVAIGIQYEPTLLLNNSNPSAIVSRNQDTTRSIFGFTNIQGEIKTDSSDVNYKRLILRPSLLDNYTSLLVLSGNSFSDKFFQNGIDGYNIEINKIPIHHTEYPDALFRGNITDTIHSYELNGDRFYLSINLRPLSNNAAPNDTVLALKIKYVTLPDTTPPYHWPSSGYIRFDSIPSSNSADTFALKFNRGTARKLDNSQYQFGVIIRPDTVFITRKMLKNAMDSRPDITLSSHFMLNNKIPFNPLFLKGRGNPSNFNTNKFVDSLQIEVIYYGKDTIAIDWIRLETKHAQMVHRGLYD